MDSAPQLHEDRAISLAPLFDHIVFVVEAGRTSARDVDRALRLLPQEKILCLVLNRHKPHEEGCDVLPQVLPGEVSGALRVSFRPNLLWF